MKIIKLPDYCEECEEYIEPRKENWFVNIFKNIIPIIFTIMTFIGYMIFNIIVKIDDIDSNAFDILVITGFILFLPAVIYYFVSKIKDRNYKNEEREKLIKFNNESKKLRVDLKKAKVLTKNSGYNIVVFEIPYKEKDILFMYKTTFYIEYEKLLLWFIFQKETVFYVNEEDFCLNYFDLEFFDS